MVNQFTKEELERYEYIRHGITQKELDILNYSGCPWTPKDKDKVNVVDILCGDTVNTAYVEEGSFHPNGCCGCTPMHDEYICGIRCDHLIWMCGWCEQYGNGNDDCLLLVGNHKGLLNVTLLYEDPEEEQTVN